MFNPYSLGVIVNNKIVWDKNNDEIFDECRADIMVALKMQIYHHLAGLTCIQSQSLLSDWGFTQQMLNLNPTYEQSAANLRAALYAFKYCLKRIELIQK